MQSIIEFNYQSEKWRNVIDETEIRQAIDQTLLHVLKDCNSYEISVVFADDAFIQDLNKRFRNKNKPTNVLSFPQTEDFSQIDKDLGHIGDIVLSYETIVSEAKVFKDHLMHLIVHGVLHLLGYDHIDDDEAEIMQQKEIAILAELGIVNPYTEETTLV